jgi:hypothetical protein
MSWDDYNQRRAAIKAVLAYAEQHPSAGLPYDLVPQAGANFRDRRELLLALQYDWSQALWARIELLSLDGGPRDAGDLAKRAWSECSAKHPVLRRLLDEHRAELGPSPREQQMLAAASWVA